jgi:signal transduction histidine kinase
LEGSLQIEQTLLDELEALRARVSELEHLTEMQRQKLIAEQHARLEVEATLHHVQEREAILRQQLERRAMEHRSQDALEALLAMAEVLVKGVDHRAAGKNDTQLSLRRIVHRLARLARRVLDCRKVSVTLVEGETGLLHPLTVAGVSSDERKRWLALLEQTQLSGYIDDADQMKALQDGESLWLGINGQETASSVACLLLPMRIGTHLSGLLSLDYGERKDSLTDEEIAIAEAVSRLIGLVLERERLLQEQAEAQANELALREANRRTDEFLSITSHELRTPLTTINGNIQLAKRRVRTLTKDDSLEEFQDKLDLVVELLSRAERQVRVQNRLVSDLLDVSRIQSNRLELHADPCDLATIVYECVEDQRASNPSRTISLSAPNDAIPVLADPDRIGQVVTNYLTNALKYSSANMPVEVHLTVEQGQARVAVRDRGPGLPPEEQQRLWQRFYRVAGINVRSGSGVGLGLGLYICRSIIERHHGEVGVQSAPDQGSTFWFTLPLIESNEKM